MTEPVRLAKRLAEMVPCSRREAELYIEGGWVSVDGQVVQEPHFRVSQQDIALHPDATLVPLEPVTILYHQPVGADDDVGTVPVLNNDNHVAGDPAAICPLKRHFTSLTVCLPLDNKAGGLHVLTQDWRVRRKLVDDAATVEQEYIVEVTGELGPHGLKQLNQSLSVNGRMLPTAKVSWQNENHLRFAIKGAKPGQIAHMCEAAGLQVRAIKRIRIGKVSMAALPVGQWRYLPPGERF